MIQNDNCCESFLVAWVPYLIYARSRRTVDLSVPSEFIGSQNTQWSSNPAQPSLSKVYNQFNNTDIFFNNTDVLFNNTDVLSNNTDVLSNNTDVLLNNTDVLFNNRDVLFNNTDVFFNNTEVLFNNTDTFRYNTKGMKSSRYYEW